MFLVLAVVVIVGSIGVYARGVYSPCSHSDITTTTSSNCTKGTTYCSRGSSPQGAKVYGRYSINGIVYNFYGNNVSETPTASSYYYCPINASYVMVYNDYSVVCDACGVYVGTMPL